MSVATRATVDQPADAIHGLGIGLPFSRELARRRGGDVWVIDAGGRGTGAVFGARVPGAVVPPHPLSREEPSP